MNFSSPAFADLWAQTLQEEATRNRLPSSWLSATAAKQNLSMENLGMSLSPEIRLEQNQLDVVV